MLAPLWAGEGREGRQGGLLRDPTFPRPSQDRAGYQGPGRCQSPALFRAVPTSRSPCSTLEEAKDSKVWMVPPLCLAPFKVLSLLKF